MSLTVNPPLLSDLKFLSARHLRRLHLGINVFGAVKARFAADRERCSAQVSCTS